MSKKCADIWNSASTDQPAEHQKGEQGRVLTIVRSGGREMLALFKRVNKLRFGGRALDSIRTGQKAEKVAEGEEGATTTERRSDQANPQIPGGDQRGMKGEIPSSLFRGECRLNISGWKVSMEKERSAPDGNWGLCEGR